jgi:hypothetical protein
MKSSGIINIISTGIGFLIAGLICYLFIGLSRNLCLALFIGWWSGYLVGYLEDRT